MQKFTQAGLTEELMNNIINSPNNALAKKMLLPIIGEKFETIKISDCFCKSKNQYHTSNFQKVLEKADRELRVLDVNSLKKITTTDKQNCFDIRKIISEKNLAQSETEALEVLAAAKSNPKNKDGNWDIVYYLDKAGELCYLCCRWIGSGWRGDAFRSSSNVWRAGFRVFYSVT